MEWFSFVFLNCDLSTEYTVTRIDVRAFEVSPCFLKVVNAFSMETILEQTF